MSPLGHELLQEAEEDPRGWGHLDIEKLLTEWGVTESLPGQDPFGYSVRIHPDLKTFTFSYPLRSELSPGSVLSICRALRELQRRLG